MTSTVQAPPPATTRPLAPDPGPAQGPRSRRWLLGFWAVVLVLLLAVDPGRQTFDTKLGVALAPRKFLSDLGQLWHDQGGFGGIADQYVGYAFPMLPYYWLTDLVSLPVWLAERLWMSLIVSVAFWGALRLAERLGVGNSASRLLGALAYALWPVFTVVVGSTSAAALPGAFLPWVLLPLTDDRYDARVAALRSALVIPFMGGVNAASTLASLLPVGLYLLSRPRGPRRRGLITWWVPGVLLATAWWIVPLLLLGVHGENFLPYVENARTTTDTMAATEALRGAGNWVAYLHFGDPWLPAGWSVTASAVVVVSSALAAGLGLAGLARRDMPERRWLVLTVLSVALITLAGYGGPFGAPFHGTVQGWLDGWLVPFRNIYKFQTGLALALVLGLAHLVGVAARADGARPVRGRRYAALAAAVLVLPGLAWPYLNGSILQPGSFQELPRYWKATADWLEKHSPDSRALVVPATAHGIYTWGSPIDQPLDVLADSRWAQRDYVPFGTPGNRRAMDAVEQALLTGGAVPGLADYLGRAGVHYVVVRNDLDPDQLGYVPTTTVKRTLEESGYRRMTGLGPVMTGGRIAQDTPIQVEGLYPRQRAVEIYEPAGASVERPGQAGLKAVADTAVVSGGPETLLPLSADPAMRDRAAVLTGDNHPGLGAPPLQVTGDGLRRADTRFGLVNANTSYTYTRGERNPPDSLQGAGEKPHQILPTDGTRHQTVAELRGARSVTASSSGNWLFHLPQYDPVNAFDGDPATAWAEGSAGSADGQWLRIGFTEETEVPSSIRVTPLPQEGVRPAPTRVRVETERGSETSTLRADGSRQRVKAPEGMTDWLKVTVVDSTARRPGLSGAGFSEISVPDVQVTRLLRLPRDAENTDAAAETVSLHRAADPGGLAPAGTEAGLHRRWTSRAAGTYTVRASAVPVPGGPLDALLYDVAPEQRNRIVATAGSTARLGTGLSPRNLTDGDLTTAWIAGDDPTVRLRWAGKERVGEMVLAAAGGLSTRPTEVNIQSPDGSTTAGVDENGMVRFAPITTDRLDVTVTETAPLTLHHPLAGEDLHLPVGLTEVYLPALEEYRTPKPESSSTFELPCGQGPTLAVDDELYETGAKGTVGDLVERRPVELTLCQEGRADPELPLEAGAHRIETGDAGPLAVTDVTLTRGTVTTPTALDRELGIRDWLGDRREVTVGSGAASYLTTYENFNDGWEATLNGRELDPVRLDGWQQGWRIPAGEGGTVKLSYGPSRVYEAGLIGGGLAVLALAGLVLFRRHSPNPDGPSPVPPAPGPALGTVALTLVGIVIAGFLALLVPLLALLARRRHTLLVPLAFLALAGAGAVAAAGAGEPVAEGTGAFGRTAQLLALVGLFAGLVSVGETSYGTRGGGRRGGRRPGASARPEVGAHPGTSAPAPLPPGSEARTEPLPPYRRQEHGRQGEGAGPGTDTGPGAPGSPPPPFVPTEPPRAAPAELPRVAPPGPPQAPPTEPPQAASGPTVTARGPGVPPPGARFGPSTGTRPDPSTGARFDPSTVRMPFHKPGPGGTGAGGPETGGAGAGRTEADGAGDGGAGSTGAGPAGAGPAGTESAPSPEDRRRTEEGGSA